MGLRLAIVGRPNVGKSTLFNRLAGKRLAIVDDRPGVTRDRREGFGRLADIELDLIDTAGLEEADADSLEGRMRAQTEKAVEDAEIALFLIDGRAGLTPLDRHFANWLRKSGKPVILAVNKCEGRAGAEGLADAYSLGLGDPIPLSAAHGEGLGDLYDALAEFAPPPPPEPEEDFWETAATESSEGSEDETAEEPVDPAKPLQVAIVGRPNVGKSTLINRVIGEERLLTGPEAGITRDAITVEWEHGGRRLRLVDTAGMRKKAAITDKLEKMSVSDSLNAIRMAEVVVLTVDANAILDKQDLTIARLVAEEGRALVIAVNKWDAAENKAEARQRIEDKLETSLPQVKGLPVVTLSALTGKGIGALMDAIISIHATWNRRVPTARLNRWLEDIVDHHPPPAVQGGRRVRLRYATQVKARPPSFVIFASRPDELPEAYMRYLVNSLRKVFDLPGVPIRLSLRKSENPYAKKE